MAIETIAPCSCEESLALRAEVAGLEKVNAELRAKLRAGTAGKLRELARELHGAVIWMSGSADFGPTGQAANGWEKLQPLLARSRDALGVEVGR